MKTFPWLTIAGLVLAVLAVNGAPQPLASPAVPAQAECKCKDLKALEIELRNAIRLQQAMRNKIPELRRLDHTESWNRYKRFTENDARRGLETVPGYEKLSEADKAAVLQFNFDVKGFALDDPIHPPRDNPEWTPAKLCSLTASADLALTRVKNLAACAGIAKAIQAHEDVHTNTCLRGFVAFFGMHAADRAQDEVYAYDAQIAVLRAEIRRVRDLKDCKHYRAAGQDGPVVYSGVICNLDQPFTVNGTHPMLVYPLKFVPSSTTGGTFSYAVSSGMMSMEGGGTYTVEGLDTDKPHIVCKVSSTASIPTASSSGSGIGNIQLIPLDTDECNGP